MHTKPHQCVIDGSNCMGADYGDLFDPVFPRPSNNASKEVPTVEPGVLPGKGRQLNGTYCPQHLMLYHKLMEWIELEEAESDPGFFSRLKKRSCFRSCKAWPEEEEHPLIVKWTPAFIEAQKDGLPIVHYKNPITGENDITMIVFDNRVLQNATPTGTVLKNMDMANYHQVIEEMGKQR